MSAMDFILSDFIFNVTLDLSGVLDTSTPSIADASSNATLQIRLSDVSGVFMFRTDATDLTDLPASDILYATDATKWLSTMNAADALTMTNPVITSDVNGTIPDAKMGVKHDFVRYLAFSLFNTALATDLFNNETDLVTSVRTAFTSVNTQIIDKITAANAKTNADTGISNVCRELMLQIAKTRPERFANLVIGTGEAVPVPLMLGDSIRFNVNVSPATGQANLTGVTAFGARSYGIKLLIVSSVNNPASA